MSQALLLRHAVFPIMDVMRDLFVAPPSLGQALLVAAQGALLFVAIATLSLGSVAVATWLSTRMTGSLHEHDEILKDNVAVAIFFALRRSLHQPDRQRGRRGPVAVARPLRAERPHPHPMRPSARGWGCLAVSLLSLHAIVRLGNRYFILSEVAGPAKGHVGRKPLAGHFRYVAIPAARRRPTSRGRCGREPITRRRVARTTGG